MEIAGRRAGAVLLALCTIAVAGLWAPPRAEAAVCQTIPAATPGTDIAINGEPHRVPGISNVKLCVDQGAVPVPSVSTDGRGICRFACLSITVPAGSIDLAGATISFNLDAETKTHVIDPGGAPGPGEACLLSVGGPDAPYPICKPGVSIGPDIEDPTAGVLPFVQDQVEAAEDAVMDAVATGVETATWAINTGTALVESLGDDVAALQQYALDTAGGLYGTACDAVPPMYEDDYWGYSYPVEFCDDAARWARAAVASMSRDLEAWERYVRDTVASLTATACNAVPPMYEYDSWGYSTPVYFCDQPTRWVAAAAASLNDDVEALRQFALELVRNLTETTCNAIPPMYEYDPWYGYREVRFCNDPVRWTTTATNGAASTTCNAIPPMYDQWGYPVYFCDDAVRWATLALKPVRDEIDRIALCINPRCIDPIMIHFLLARVPTA